MSKAKNPSINLLANDNGAEKIGFGEKTVRQGMQERGRFVATINDLAAEAPEIGEKIAVTEAGKAGEFVTQATGQSDPESGVYVTCANGVIARRVHHGILNAKWFGASEANTKTANRTAVQAAIALADAEGGGVVYVPDDCDYGLVNSDPTTQPDFNGLVNDVMVMDDSRADADPAGNKTGFQRRVFLHTPQTDPKGQHNGNGFRIFGNWHPYHWIENNAQYAPKGDPSRDALDNRRASLFFANDSEATWRIGQGNRVGDLDDDEMSNFVIEAFNTPVNAGTYAPLVIERKTGNASYGGGTTQPPASHHFRSVTTGYPNHMIESLGTVVTTVLRTANGSGDDTWIRNNAGVLELHVPGVGSALDVTRADRGVRINSMLNLPKKSRTALPTAANYEGGMVYCTDANGGAAPVFSNGSGWVSLLTGNAP